MPKVRNSLYVAALCLNVDLTLFQGLRCAVDQFVGTAAAGGPRETLDPANADVIRARIDRFAARHGTAPRALKAGQRRALLHDLMEAGCLQVRRSAEVIAAHLGVSRATVYADVNRVAKVKSG